MSEALSQQERLQAIAEKRKRQTEIENKKRQLEDDRRQLQHLKSKALRERWLLDGAPSAGSEEDEAKKQLQEDEAKTKGLEEAIMRLEQELEELETGVSATSTKESLSDVAQQEEVKSVDNKVIEDSIKVVREIKEVKVHVSPRLEKSRGDSDMMRAAMYSVEITVEKDLATGETKVLSTSTLLPKDLSQQGVKVYEDEQKVVHEVGAVANGVHQLSSSEVEELIHKADEITMSEGSSKATPKREAEEEEKAKTEAEPAGGGPTAIKEITGVEAKPAAAAPQAEVNEASAENPVTMVFMGYQNVEDEDETKKVLGLESTTVKAELVVIEDGENKSAPSEAKEEQEAPPNGGPAEPDKAQEASGEAGEPEAGKAEIKSKEKQPCKCCSIM
ncbi:paralemmin 1a isoform X3 [Colossoma macropomum]|uniref:paralemmin 1a isoform X3 n=1 Tax=Colossoma macropomum TaxID=42526 RepID=UPI00186508B0|nr:paralemmin 1a isoform X3 [Colossoma macropomum]